MYITKTFRTEEERGIVLADIPEDFRQVHESRVVFPDATVTTLIFSDEPIPAAAEEPTEPTEPEAEE